jgi:hypothetical protein
MKASELDPHKCHGPALARRAHTGEKKGEKARMAWRKVDSLFSDVAEHVMDVWALQVAIDNDWSWAMVDG